jgi:hypothetical protein
MFLQNVDSYKRQTQLHPRRGHSSIWTILSCAGWPHLQHWLWYGKNFYFELMLLTKEALHCSRELLFRTHVSHKRGTALFEKTSLSDSCFSQKRHCIVRENFSFGFMLLTKGALHYSRELLFGTHAPHKRGTALFERTSLSDSRFSQKRNCIVLVVVWRNRNMIFMSRCHWQS